MPRPLLLGLVTCAAMALAGPLPTAQADPTLTLAAAGAPLAGATVDGGATVTATAPAGTVKVKWVLDGGYLGTDADAPWTLRLPDSPGAHTLRARSYTADGTETRTDESFSIRSTASPTPTPTPTPTPPPPAGGTSTTTVTDTAGLVAALANARPGTSIRLADGTYAAKQALTVATACTAAAPCSLVGGPGAVLDGHGTSGVYGLHLSGAAYWTLSGFTVTDASKGVVLDDSDHDVLDSLDVGNIGDEGIHLRSGSSDNVVRGSRVHDTGKRVPGYGEGLYVGSAKSNWGTYSGGLPDRSDRNVLQGNTTLRTTAESVDVKEGTTGGSLVGNSFDGAGMSGANHADSWVDVKGNDWTVRGNTGVRALLDGFQTHVVTAGWGQGTVFRGNVADVRGPGYGFRVQDPSSSRTTVACDNTASSAASGLANLACR